MWSKLIKASFNIPQIEKLIIFKLFFSWFCLLIFWPLYKKTENPDFSWISNQTIIQPTNNYSCFYFRKSEQLSIQTLCGQFGCSLCYFVVRITRKQEILTLSKPLNLPNNLRIRQQGFYNKHPIYDKRI